MKNIGIAAAIMTALVIAEQVGELIQHNRQMKVAEKLRTRPSEIIDNETLVALMQNREINKIVVDAMKKIA